jgi:hypothetical protein
MYATAIFSLSTVFTKLNVSWFIARTRNEKGQMRKCRNAKMRNYAIWFLKSHDVAP